MHETYAEHAIVAGPSNRSFGLTVGLILLAIFGYQWWWWGTLSWLVTVILVIGLFLVVAGVLAPRVLAPLNRLWTRFGLLLAMIVNPIVMILMFVVIFLPIAMIMRLLGRDSLRRKLDPSATSYWITRNKAAITRESFGEQF